MSLDGLKYDQTVSRVIVPTHMDYAVVALIDPRTCPMCTNRGGGAMTAL